MPDFSPFALAATALAATLAGIMLFFAAVVTPAVFKTLERAEAGQVVRTLFPKYYVLGTVLAATAAGLAGIDCALVATALLAGVAGLFALERLVMLPMIDKHRAGRASGEPAATRKFGALHRASVFLNMGQLLATIAAAVMLAA
ncbi:MAG: DUF4149 domain-containing protein [Alphaproteobacteria bacterium]|jgi:hypothetical protein|nr:DUF4149 domain-containing protein [Alphaproteobacteria bacterium]